MREERRKEKGERGGGRDEKINQVYNEWDEKYINKAERKKIKNTKASKKKKKNRRKDECTEKKRKNPRENKKITKTDNKKINNKLIKKYIYWT